MREIARRAGFANGALKHFFTGKDQIIQGTYEQSLGMMTEHLDAELGQKRGFEALRAMCVATMPTDPERITAGRVLLSFWERAVSNKELHDTYSKHLTAWRAALGNYIVQGREDGDIVTNTADDELIDEIIMMNVGANILTLLEPGVFTIKRQEANLASFFTRLREP